MDERTFQGYVLGWLSEILKEDPSLPFALPEQERRATLSRLPSDITLRDKLDPSKWALVGELKLPDAPDGTAPDRNDVVQKTLQKANEVRANWFFTWNVNDLILWDNSRGPVPLIERRFEHFTVPRPIFERRDLDKPEALGQYKPFLTKVLREFAAFYRGEEQVALKPLHRQFAVSLEVNLRPIIGALHRDLVRISAENKPLRFALERHMTDVLEWTLHEDSSRSADFERLARLSAYLLANKFVFYETLRAQGYKLARLTISERIKTGERLALLMNDYFEDAREKSDDYETIFEEIQYRGRVFTTDSIVFLSDDVVSPIRELAARISEFNLSNFDYDIIGEIYQTLNDPRERHRFGQHYTTPEIVDLINAFCVQTPEDIVFDPSCGGGTFLVRAYARKKFLARRDGRTPPALAAA